MILLPNINFLSSKQNRTTDIDPKMLKQCPIFDTNKHDTIMK